MNVKTGDALDQTLIALKGIRRVSEMEYHLEKLRKMSTALLDMCPVQPGDKVELLETPRIDDGHSWGWLGAKHFLVAGIQGTAVDVDWRDGWVLDVTWDNQTFRGLKGEYIPLEKPYTYCHRANKLKKVYEEPKSKTARWTCHGV